MRRFLFDNRLIACGVIALAIVLRAVFPAGFMPVIENGVIKIELCSGYGPEKMAMTMPDMSHKGAGKDGMPGKEMPCSGSSLSFQSLAGADVDLLALAIAFVMAIGLRFAISAVPAGFADLRPPLRGPPLTD